MTSPRCTKVSLPAVIFDCDGVLVQSEAMIGEIASELLCTLGVHISPNEAQDLFLGQTISTVAELIENLTGSRVPSSWVYEFAMATAYGFVKGLKPTPGVQDLLHALLSRGQVLGVASQSSISRLRLTLHVTALDAHFAKNVFSAAMVGRPKPAPDIFLYSARTMGVSPRDCIVIEDSPLGISAARAAGMQVFAYAGSNNPTNLSATGARVFKTMKDIRDALMGCP